MKLKNNYSLGQLTKMPKLWNKILKIAYSQLGQILIETFANTTLCDSKLLSKSKAEFVVDMKTKTVETALKKALINKFWKNIWHREIGNEIIALYKDYKEKDLSSLLDVISKEAGVPYHPFDITTYTENIVLSNEILVFGPDTIGKAYLKRNILLSNSLVYIGFFDAHQKEISKFYFNNNLKYTINKTEGGSNEKYKVQAYINDSSTVLIDVQEGNIKEAILMIKGSTYG